MCVCVSRCGRLDGEHTEQQAVPADRPRWTEGGHSGGNAGKTRVEGDGHAVLHRLLRRPERAELAAIPRSVRTAKCISFTFSLFSLSLLHSSLSTRLIFTSCYIYCLGFLCKFSKFLEIL